MSVTVGGVRFDRVSCDRRADVLYLHVGEPDRAVDFDESPEGMPCGSTGEGHATVTEPAWHLERADLAEALGLAS